MLAENGNYRMAEKAKVNFSRKRLRPVFCTDQRIGSKPDIKLK